MMRHVFVLNVIVIQVFSLDIQDCPRADSSVDDEFALSEFGTPLTKCVDARTTDLRIRHVDVREEDAQCAERN